MSPVQISREPSVKTLFRIKEEWGNFLARIQFSIKEED